MNTSKKIFLAAISTTALFGLTACGGTPNCSSSKTIGMLKQAVAQEFQAMRWDYIAAMKRDGSDQQRYVDHSNFDSFQTIAHDKDSDTYQCQAFFSSDGFASTAMISQGTIEYSVMPDKQDGGYTIRWSGLRNAMNNITYK